MLAAVVRSRSLPGSELLRRHGPLRRTCRPLRFFQTHDASGSPTYHTRLGRHANKNKLRVMFFGTDDFSVTVLEALNNVLSSGCGSISKLEVCCLPMVSLKPDVQAFAEKHALPLHFWPLTVRRGTFDIGVVASFGKLIPKTVIQSFPRGMLNVHASLLPRWRGASPIVHALLSGDEVTGISIMEIRPHHFDVGCVLAQESITIDRDTSRQDLSRQLAVVGARLMVEVLDDLDEFERKKTPQALEGVTYAPMLNKAMLQIDWNAMSADDVWNRFRALRDFGKLRTVWKDTGEQVRLDSMVHPSVVGAFDISRQDSREFVPGEVLLVKRPGKRYVFIKCRVGWAAFEDFYYGKKRKMNAIDFYNGFMSKHRKTAKKLSFVAADE